MSERKVTACQVLWYRNMLKRSLKNWGRLNSKHLTDGWSLRKRHQIVFNELCGESSDVNSQTIEEWVAKLPSIIQGYEPENIANGDETGLIFHALPNKSPPDR